MQILAFLTLLLSAADHWTTYICLRSPIEGWSVAEANPLADWLFQSVGLVNGLLIDSLVTLCAVGFLLTTKQIPDVLKGFFFSLVIVWTGFAVLNNWQAMSALELSLLGPA